MSATRSVLVAMMLSALLIIVSGDAWDTQITRFQAVKPAPKAGK